MIAKPLLETHKLDIDGVILYVRIDYRDKNVSFTDERGNANRFEFTKRGRNYLGGWVRIYRALEKATVWADKRLADYEEQERDAKSSELVQIFTALSGLKDKEEAADA